MADVVVDACERCRYWVAIGRAVDGGPHFGSCRANPPIMGAGQRGQWPSTAADDYCGRFTPARDPSGGSLAGVEFKGPAAGLLPPVPARP